MFTSVPAVPAVPAVLGAGAVPAQGSAPVCAPPTRPPDPAMASRYAAVSASTGPASTRMRVAMVIVKWPATAAHLSSMPSRWARAAWLRVVTTKPPSDVVENTTSPVSVIVFSWTPRMSATTAASIRHPATRALVWRKCAAPIPTPAPARSPYSTAGVSRPLPVMYPMMNPAAAPTPAAGHSVRAVRTNAATLTLYPLDASRCALSTSATSTASTADPKNPPTELGALEAAISPAKAANPPYRWPRSGSLSTSTSLRTRHDVARDPAANNTVSNPKMIAPQGVPPPASVVRWLDAELSGVPVYAGACAVGAAAALVAEGVVVVVVVAGAGVVVGPGA